MGRIRFNPPECFSGCTDPWCPYVHQGAWFCGDAGPFSTEAEALAADNRREDQLTILVGDELTDRLIGRR